MKLLNFKNVYENPLPQLESRQCYFPNLCETDDGTLLCCFHMGQAMEAINCHQYISESRDNGNTWSAPRRMFEDASTPMTESCKLTNIGEGKIMALGYAYFRDDPSLPLGNPETGGLVTQAHPYRQDSYIEWIRLYPWNTDGAEILNASRPDFESNIAAAYADTYHLLKTCGSDNHKAGRAEYLGCMSTDIPLNSKADYIRAVREGICDIDKIRNPLSENTGV